MAASSISGSKAFQSEKWDPYIVEREGHCIWFGFTWQREGGIIISFFALAFVGIGAGIFLEGEGLKANLKDATCCVMGAAAFLVALLIAWAGIYLMKSTNRIAKLDLENALFSAADPRTGEAGRAIPCRDLYIHLTERPPLESDTEFQGEIRIMGPEKPDETNAPPEVDKTILHGLAYEAFFEAARELERAATWKGLIGSETWINMHRYHSRKGSSSDF